MAFAFGKMVQLKRSLEQNNARLKTKLILLIPIKTKKENTMQKSKVGGYMHATRTNNSV